MLKAEVCLMTGNGERFERDYAITDPKWAVDRAEDLARQHGHSRATSWRWSPNHFWHAATYDGTLTVQVTQNGELLTSEHDLIRQAMRERIELAMKDRAVT